MSSTHNRPHPYAYPFRDNPEWADITPVPQDDGPNPVVSIAYTPQFRETMDYFRAILRKNELSQRALHLTADVIELNAANYTAWNYRRQCLKALNEDLIKELAYVEATANETPKNYQLWHHRRTLLEEVGHPVGDLEHTASLLRGDSKNYHVWSHRQWVLKRFSLWNQELDFVDSLLQPDPYNNSAWNQRYYVINNTTKWTPQVIDRELSYTFGYVQLAPNNESPWNYLTGMLNEPGFDQHERVGTFAHDIFTKHPTCTQALSFVVEVYDKMGTSVAIEKAIKACSLLATSLDSIRQKYWQYRGELMTARALGDVSCASI